MTYCKMKWKPSLNSWYSTKNIQMVSVFSGPYFTEFELNTVTYSVNVRIRSEDWKIQTKAYNTQREVTILIV